MSFPSKGITTPIATQSRPVTETPEAIELAIRLLEAHHHPEKVEAALVYRGYTKQAAREVVQGVLSGRIHYPLSENDERAPADWATFPAPTVLALGLVILTITVAGAVTAGIRYRGGLIAGLLISCAGLQRLLGPRRRRLSTTLCALLTVLATAAACFVRLPH